MKVRDCLIDRLIIECFDINFKFLVEVRIFLEFKIDWYFFKLGE